MKKTGSSASRPTVIRETFYIERPDDEFTDRDYMRMYADMVEMEMMSCGVRAEVVLYGGPKSLQSAASRIELQQEVVIKVFGAPKSYLVGAIEDAIKDTTPVYEKLLRVVNKPNVMDYTTRPEK